MDYFQIQRLEIMQSNVQVSLRNYTNKLRDSEIKLRNANTRDIEMFYTAEVVSYNGLIRELKRRYRELSANISTLRAMMQSVPRVPTTRQSQQQTQQPADKVPIATSTPIKIPEDFFKNHPKNIPDEFICPISMEIMTDPVLLTDGQVYEKQYIEKWLKTHNTSPLTKALVKKDMIPCFALRNLIQKFVNGQYNNDAIDADTSSLPKTYTQQQTQKKAPQQKREPSKYNLFVKEQISIYKALHPEIAPKERMKLVAAAWKQQQTS